MIGCTGFDASDVLVRVRNSDGSHAQMTIYPISLFNRENEGFHVGLLNFTHFSGSLVPSNYVQYCEDRKVLSARAAGST